MHVFVFGVSQQCGIMKTNLSHHTSVCQACKERSHLPAAGRTRLFVVSLSACCLSSEVNTGWAGCGRRRAVWCMAALIWPALRQRDGEESKHLHFQAHSKAHKPQGIFQYGRCCCRGLTHTHTHTKEITVGWKHTAWWGCEREWRLV